MHRRKLLIRKCPDRLGRGIFFVAMTLDKFRSLAPRVQVTLALMRGTYLAHRWEDEGKVSLYYFADGGRGFFVEAGYDESQQRAVVLRSFSSSVPLEDYAHGVQLPEW
jgi:hypothetical protein